MKKIILSTLGFFILIALFFIFLFRDWPVVKKCEAELAQFNANGIWSAENQTFFLLKDSFSTLGFIDETQRQGSWEYEKNGFINFHFQNPDAALLEFLEMLENKNASKTEYIYTKEGFKNYTTQADKGSASLKVQIRYDQNSCDLSSPFFYIEDSGLNGPFSKKQFNNILED